MNAGIITTIALFIVMQIFDPEGTLSVETQIAIGGVAFTCVMWLKTKVDEFKKAEETKQSSISSPSIESAQA